MERQRNPGSAMPARRGASGPSILEELLRQQLPIVAALLAAGFAAAYLQYGYLPGGDAPFPLAGVRVPIWHLIWMGAWTGYTMALVGQAAGIFALPYTTSVLQFSNPHVTPSTLLLTFVNPIGALLGFRRTGQWNLDFAGWLCAGGIIGGLVGPFLRSTLLVAADPFRFALGLMLVLAGAQLLNKVSGGFSVEAATRAGPFGNGEHQVRIETLTTANGRLTIGYLGHKWTLKLWVLFAVGAVVGVISSALGLGGAFLIVPILIIVYKLPMYV